MGSRVRVMETSPPFSSVSSLSSASMAEESDCTNELNGEFKFNGQKKLAKCFREIVDTPKSGKADVIFEAGGKQFGGLKDVLSTRSEVFQRMFQGTFKEARSTEAVRLPQFDVAPQAFCEFLLFMHAGRARLNSILEVTELYQMAKYFAVSDLEIACHNRLRHYKPNVETAVELFAFAEEHALGGLKRRQAFFIGHNADAVLRQPGKAALLPRAFLRRFFEGDQHEVSETVLFEVLLQMDPEFQKELIPFVRLPLIPTAIITKTVLPSGLFNMESCFQAVAFQADPQSVELPQTMTRTRGVKRPIEESGAALLARLLRRGHALRS